MNKKFIPIILFFLSSCISTQGALVIPKSMEKPGSGTVRTETPLLLKGKDILRIQSVDGVAVDPGLIAKVVTAGIRNVVVELELIERVCLKKCKDKIKKAQTTLTFEVLANKNYLISVKKEADSTLVYAYEEESETVVAGVKI